jgi:hypothetical protein
LVLRIEEIGAKMRRREKIRKKKIVNAKPEVR